MNDRQRLAYENPLTRVEPWGLLSGCHKLIAVRGVYLNSMLVVCGSFKGERPSWFVVLLCLGEDLHLVELASLTGTQRQAIRDYAHELLEGVGLEPGQLLEGSRDIHMFKDLTDEEIEGLPAAAKLPPRQVITKVKELPA
jgi:hypothetical protein